MRKLLALVLVIALIGITACSPKDEATNTTEENGTDVATDTGEDAQTPETESDTPVTLRMAMKDLSPSDETHQAYIQRIEDGLADKGVYVDLEVIEMAQGNYAENLGLMLLGGDVPDIIYFQGGDEQMANQGLLEDLTPYIEKSEVISGALLDYQKERIANYPYLLWIKPIASKVPVVRTDFFEGMENGEALLADPSIDNYYAFFQEMAEKNTTYAFTAPGKLLEIDTIFDNAFGVTGTWIEVDGEYVFGRVTDMERDKLEFYAKLYADGLLDPEYLTKAWDTKEQVFYANEVGVISGTSGKVIDIYDGNMISANGESANLTVLPPAKGVAQGYNPISVTKETRGLAISAISEHKDLAWEVIDFLASYEGQYIDRLGFEGEQYNIVDGQIELTEASSNWFAFFFEMPEWEPKEGLKKPLLGPAAMDSLDMAQQYYVADTDVVIPAEYAPQLDAVNNLYNEFSADVITGKRSISEWDDFVSEWYAQGGEAITEYANSMLK